MGPGGGEGFVCLFFVVFVFFFFCLDFFSSFCIRRSGFCRTRDILGTGGEKLPTVQADVLLTLKEAQVPGRFKCCPLYPSQSGRPQTKLEMTQETV